MLLLFLSIPLASINRVCFQANHSFPILTRFSPLNLFSLSGITLYQAGSHLPSLPLPCLWDTSGIFLDCSFSWSTSSVHGCGLVVYVFVACSYSFSAAISCDYFAASACFGLPRSVKLLQGFFSCVWP